MKPAIHGDPPIIHRLVSVYSKAFYTYMTAICQGAVGNFDNLIDYREEISALLRRPTQKVGTR